MVSTRPLISTSSSPFISPLETVPSASVKIGITVTIMFHIFLFSSKVFPSFRFSFSFTQGSAGMAKFPIQQFFVFFFFCYYFFFLSITRSGHLVVIKWSACISKKKMCVLFSSTNSGLCIYHLFVWSNLNCLHDSQWITFSHPVVSSLRESKSP